MLLLVQFIHAHILSHRNRFARLVKEALIDLSKLAILSRTVLFLANLFDISSSVPLKLVPFCNTIFFLEKMTLQQTVQEYVFSNLLVRITF